MRLRYQPTTIELCAGIAGFSSPLTRPLALVEKEPTCRAVLRRHHPHALILDDVRSAGADTLPAANIIKFGFPCQDLSVAGNRAGLAGARSGLYYECTRIVDELRPDFAVWENVPGLLSSDDGRDFARVLMELERIGYCGSWTTLDAQFFGVAQRRQRVFGVFTRRDIGAAVCAEILSLAARMPWNTQAGRTSRAGVARSVTASAGHHGHSSPRGDGSDNLVGFHASAFGVPAEGTGILRASGGDNGPGSEILVAPAIAATLSSGNAASAGVNLPGRRQEDDYNLVAVSIAENQRGELRTSDIAAQLTVGGGNPGQGYPAVLTVRTANTGANGHGIAEDITHTLDGAQGQAVFTTREIAPALTRNYGKQSDNSDTNLGPSVATDTFGVRRLTPRECERLQGFEDDYTAWGIDERAGRVEMSDSTRYRMLGNAVCKRVSAWIDQRIVEVFYA
jgi:DNA (cytosine-5)-methyltransferase 1